MKVGFIAIVIASGLAVPSMAAEIQIKSVKISPMSKAHLCRGLGGQGKDPELVIRHSKEKGAKISIRMFDNVSNGATVNHFSTRVAANPSGVTKVRFNFLPPCNVTNTSISSYKFMVKSGRSKKLVKWGRYDSRKRKILR